MKNDRVVINEEQEIEEIFKEVESRAILLAQKYPAFKDHIVNRSKDLNWLLICYVSANGDKYFKRKSGYFENETSIAFSLELKPIYMDADAFEENIKWEIEEMEVESSIDNEDCDYFN